MLKLLFLIIAVAGLSHGEKKPLTIDEAIARDEITDPVKVKGVIDLDERLNSEQQKAMFGSLPSEITKRNALKDLTTRWTNGVIPFAISNAFSLKEKSVIVSAMREWQTYTCLRFRTYKPGDRHVIVLKKIGGCWSWIGMQKKPQQKLTLGPSCVYKGIVVHELGHALGFMHEQARPDRDKFVLVLWQNVQGNQKYNFKKANWAGVTTFNKPYDYASIMHYGKYEFSGNKRPTIMVKPQYKKYENDIGNRYGVSFWDVRSANLMYKCSRRCGAKRCAKGFLGPDCTCWCQGPNLRSPVVYCTTRVPISQTKIGAKPKARNPNNFPKVGFCQDKLAICGFAKQKLGCLNIRMRVVCPRSCGLCNRG